MISFGFLKPMKSPIYQRRMLIAALVFALVASLLLKYKKHTPVEKTGGSKQHEQMTEAGPQPYIATQPTLPKNPTTGEIIWKVGKPSPLKPVVRGENKQRQFGAPRTIKLPELNENSFPSILAMTPADGRLHLLPEETDLYTLKSRRMVLDTAALDRVIAGETNHIIAPTTGTEILDLKIQSIRTRSNQTHSLIGKVEGEELSDVLLVYHDGIIHGTVARYATNQHLEYRILSDGHMMVREIDAAAIPEGCKNPGAELAHSCNSGCKHESAEQVDQPPANPSPETGPIESGDTTGWTTIDVVVGYDIESRIADGGVSQIEARIISNVDYMTNAFINSLVTNTELMLLGTIEDPDYVFPGINATEMGTPDELGDLNDFSDGNLDTVSDYSTLLGADLVSFVCKDSQGGTAGIAYRPGRSSIVSRTSMTSSALTFPHELGHNLGAQHSLGDGTSDTVLNTARYGIRSQTTSGVKYRTIMAYAGSWGGGRIPHYANPNVNYGGTPTGVIDGANLTGNAYIDPYYATAGYNGTNPSLGARNAQMFLVQEGSNGVVFASNRSTRTSLAVTSPVAAAQWAAGSTKTISFTGGDMDYTADIDLYKGGVYQYTIANDIDAIDHFFTWNIPLAQEGGNNFKIRVSLTHPTKGTTYAESGNFVIQATNDIILNSPIGGESWSRNTRKNITWSSSYSGNVKIEYIKGAAAPVTIVASTPDDGSYQWTIPFDLTLGSDYQIRITSSVSPFDSSQSASNFSIVAPSNNLLVTNLDTNPGFTMSGEFQYGAPQAGNGATSPKTGTNMYDTNLAATSFGSSSLTTYAIDCSNHTNIILDFWAYILIWTDYYVEFEVSKDNSNWTKLATIGQGVTLNQPWTRYTYDITSIAAGEPTVYIRWSMIGSGTQYSGGGLSIDDISITGDFIPADGISVISPNGGDNVFPNIQRQITWLSDMGGNVKIELLKNGSLNTTIAPSTSNDGFYHWTPPTNQTLGNDYKIRITSLANATRNDESNANFSVVAAPTASTIPYSESFETNFGAWIQPSTDTMDWTRSNIPTPSANTGPDAASQGSYYLFTEASGFLNKTAELTNWFDLRSTASPQLTFYYHMFGSSMGTLRLQASLDGVNWATLFEESGTNQNLWKSQVINLSAYAGKYVQLKFSGTTGSDWASDMAIDQISIIETAATTYTVTYNANATITGNTPSSQTKGQNVNLTLSDGGTMTRSGYTCTGWNTAADGSGTSYALAGTYAGNANLTLYAQWTFTAYQIWAGEGTAYTGDANNDGIANGLAWLLGASDSMAPINGKLPIASSSSGNLVMNFSILNSSNRGAAVVRLQYSNDLGVTDPWAGNTVVIPDLSGTVGGISFVVTANGNMNQIQATIPASEASSSGKLFGRLSTSSP